MTDAPTESPFSPICRTFVRVIDYPSAVAPIALIGVPAGVPPLPLPFRQRGDELAAEGRDVGDDATPDQVPFAEGRLVHPGSPCVHQVVLYPEGARGVEALYY